MYIYSNFILFIQLFNLFNYLIRNMVAYGPKIKVNVPKASRPNSWSKKLTPVENYAMLGITIDPNASSSFTQKINENRMRTKPNAELSGAKIEDELPNVPISNERSLPPVIPDYRAKQLDELISRHGENYQKMAMDKKYNYLQETVTQLKKHIEVYLLWKSKQQELSNQEIAKQKELEEQNIQSKIILSEKVKENIDFDEAKESYEEPITNKSTKKNSSTGSKQAEKYKSKNTSKLQDNSKSQSTSIQKRKREISSEKGSSKKRKVAQENDS